MKTLFVKLRIAEKYFPKLGGFKMAMHKRKQPWKRRKRYERSVLTEKVIKTVTLKKRNGEEVKIEIALIDRCDEHSKP